MNFSEKDRAELLYCLFEPSFAEILGEKLRNGDTFLLLPRGLTTHTNSTYGLVYLSYFSHHS